MEATTHAMPELFEQLGLPGDEASIQDFIRSHSPLPETVLLPDAPFWSPSQSAFLRENWKADADWVELIDQLNLSLRG